MKKQFNSIIITLIVFMVAGSQGNDEREGKILKQHPAIDGLNFDHIITLWNRSAAVPVASEEPPISQRWSMPNDRRESSKLQQTLRTTAAPQARETQRPFRNLPAFGDSFPERFKFCVGQQQKQTRGAEPGQNIIIKCFKSELIWKLQRLLTESDPSIKLFNGYLEFEKIRKSAQNESQLPRKRYSSRVASKKTDFASSTRAESLVPVQIKQSKVSQDHGSEYYENYQKMLKELVARKSGSETYQRLKREAYDKNNSESLEQTANLFESGRQLFSEITNRLDEENGQSEFNERHKREADEESNSETLKKTANLFENGRKLFSEITNRLENEEEDVENLTETILDPELVSTLNRFTRSYAVKLNFYPGISARMKRNQSSGVTFDLELDELAGDDDDDDDEDDEDAGRGDKKKKKKKKIKISKKTLKKLFPYLLIPFMIQAALLPFVLKFLLFVAIKALIAGKLALILVAFNVLKNASHKSDEDEYAERMAVEHYGYGNGEEYGAWVNRRNFNVPEDKSQERNAENDPYRAHRNGRKSD